METKINTISHSLPVTSASKKNNAKTALKQQLNYPQITSLSNIYYLHPSMKGVNISPNVSNILSNLTKNDCGSGILNDIEGLNENEKKQFIKEYCKSTGFPELDKINKKMKKHAIETLKRSAIESNTRIISCGYHKHCSAALDLALPGSDLDALSVIISGGQEQVNNFSGALWRNMNPSLVSIRKDYEFPDIYTIDQLYEWTKLTNDIVLHSDPMLKNLYDYKDNLKETNDYEKALAFNIDVGKELKKYPIERIKELAPSVAEMLSYPGRTPKNVNQSMSSLLETLRSGNALIVDENLSPEEKGKIDYIKLSFLYKLGNMCIQEADYGIKQKLIDRKDFINKENFEKLSTDDQLDLVLRMIYESFPTWAKKQSNKKYGQQFEYLFDNGKNVNASRDRAYLQAVDS